jgi:hypothetical protein
VPAQQPATKTTITPTPSLLASVSNWQPPDAPLLALIEGFETGTIPTAPARDRRRSYDPDRFGGRFHRCPYQRSPDPSLSRLRRKQLADRPALPPNIRLWLTESERAFGQLLRERYVEKGYFDLTHDEAAARLGCCSKTIKRSQDRYRDLKLISVEERPRPGRKNLPNVVRIISAEWLAWIDTDPKAARAARARQTAPPQGDIDVKPREQAFRKQEFCCSEPVKGA